MRTALASIIIGKNEKGKSHFTYRSVFAKILFIGFRISHFDGNRQKLPPVFAEVFSTGPPFSQEQNMAEKKSLVRSRSSTDAQENRK